jgi:hypothetical protein
MATLTGKKIRSVDQYIEILARAKKSPVTLRDYKYILADYAKFIGVPLTELHKHLDPEDLMKYSDKLDKRAPVTRKKFIGTVARFMKLNGVVFDDLEQGVILSSEPEERGPTAYS